MSFFVCWLCVCWLVILGASIGVCVQAVKITGKKPQYISIAKLVATGQMEVGTSGTRRDFLQDFYGTIIETLGSSEMRRRALDRLRALHPDLKESEITIKVTQNKGSSIFHVRAFGSEPKYTRYFLDSLLDEFMAYRNQIKGQNRNMALTTLHEDVIRREKTLKEKQEKLTRFKAENNVTLLAGELERLNARLLKLRDERDDLDRKQREAPGGALEKSIASVATAIAQVEKDSDSVSAQIAIHEGLAKDAQDSRAAYDQILDLVRRYDVAEKKTDYDVTIMERASGAVEDLQEWAFPIAIGGVAGGLAGLLLSLLIAVFIHGVIRSTKPPPLPIGE